MLNQVLLSCILGVRNEIKPKLRSLLTLIIISSIFLSCKRKEDTLFELLPSSKTNVTFNNRITETDSFNVLTFEYIYNGAGVAAADFNNDGFSDLFFPGNMVSSRLYLNRGNFSFQDVTKLAEIETKFWCTGVSVVDINQDGLKDIYVSTIQPERTKQPVPNLFFLNKGIDKDGVPSFQEIASKIGLADSSYSTQASFFDYDLDGDLDMYLLNNALEDFNRNQAIGPKNDGSGKSIDKLYRNEGIVDGLPVFKDVSVEAGITQEGWGLGVVVNDINKDGYPDIYIANDFISNDNILINHGNGRFTDNIRQMMKHQEQNGMGVDIADINNDALNDVIVMDMMPDDNLRQKTMFTTIGYSRFFENRQRGYQDQYVRNVLQLNNGNNTFSDIGYLSGIYATDWSWSSLMADFDNDGYRDILITNGYRKDITDQDFIAYGRETALFTTDKNRMNIIRQEVEKLPGVDKPNFLFRNNGDLTFTDKAKEWGLDQRSFSNGVAYVDLDNDGDLDIVTNNINNEAFIYKNKQRDQKTKDHNKYLRVKLAGRNGNLDGLGAKVYLFKSGEVWYAEHQLQRGYKSSVENFLHFGLGRIQGNRIDSLKVIWLGGKSEVIPKVPLDTVIYLNEKNANVIEHRPKAEKKIFSDVHEDFGIWYKHNEEEFVDFNFGQGLLPHKHSQSGPPITVADINMDGLEDFIVGGSARKRAKIFLQQKDKTFTEDSLPEKVSEDTDLLLFDADDDGDNDLYCVSGSSEFGEDVRKYQDRFYKNIGKGKFLLDTLALPNILSSGSCVSAKDFDKDGDLDLFVGGRISPNKYPYPPESYFLLNDGQGKFSNRTKDFSDDIGKVGMVTASVWNDVDNDGWQDLIVVGEWMPITIFINQKGKRFVKTEIERSSGWWNSISSGDFDKDGDEDFIVGNLGFNSVYKASAEEPVTVCASDFDENGTVDAILCRYIQGKEYPVHPRETLTGQMPGLRNILTRYSVYGKLALPEIISEQKLKKAFVLKSNLLASIYLENNGNKKFSIHLLPVQAQISPIFGSVATDVNGDGFLDVITVGNSFATEPLTGLYDAGFGNCLLGDGKGSFNPLPPTKSGFFVDGDAKFIAPLTLSSGKKLYIVSQNRDSLRVFLKEELR